MYPTYYEKRIPVQLRRLMIFNEICCKAKMFPDEMVHLNYYSNIAFGVIYSTLSDKYTAFGSVFEYAHTRAEVVQQGLDKLAHDEYISSAMTVKRQPFTKACRTSLSLLLSWNKYVSNKPSYSLSNDIKHFFPVNDELKLDYPPHKLYGRLVANADLPLWNNEVSIISDNVHDLKTQ